MTESPVQALQAARERLQALQQEDQALTDRLVTIPATPKTRDARAKFRAQIQELRLELSAAAQDVMQAEVAVARARRLVEEMKQAEWRGNGAELGQMVRDRVRGVVALVEQVQRLDARYAQSRAIARATCMETGDVEQIAPPGLLYSATLAPSGLWQLLLELGRELQTLENPTTGHPMLRRPVPGAAGKRSL